MISVHDLPNGSFNRFLHFASLMSGKKGKFTLNQDISDIFIESSQMALSVMFVMEVV